MLKAMRRLIRREEGATAIEFAFVLPLFLAFVLGTIDVGGYFFSAAELQAGTNRAARLVRTGEIRGTGTAIRDAFRTEVCNRVQRAFIKNCLTTLRVDARAGTLATGFGGVTLPNNDTNGDGNITDAETAFDTGVAGGPVIIRVYYRYGTIVPGLARFFTAVVPGQNYLRASVAIRNEPFT